MEIAAVRALKLVAEEVAVKALRNVRQVNVCVKRLFAELNPMLNAV